MSGGTRWNVTTEVNTAHLVTVFSGGACNILDEKGALIRNQERDRVNDWLSHNKIMFHDPQIHPDTHGEEYDYEKHSAIEIAARNAAKINLYEVSPLTFSGITSLEIAADHFKYGEPTVIYFSDGSHEHDRIPEHSPEGYPLFVPKGITDNDAAKAAHYREFVKNGNNMRKYVIHFARKLSSLTIDFSQTVHKGDTIISPERIHASDLFGAVVRASRGERVFVNFIGGPDAQDSEGNPTMNVPANPTNVQRNALLDQYVDEGNELRKSISELLHVDVFTRVVYTQESAIQALHELLRATKLMPD